MGTPVRQLRPDQPRHAAPRDSAVPPPLVLLPARPALRRHRRVPHLPRRLRLACRPGAAPAPPPLRPLRRRSGLPARLGHRGAARGGRGPSHRSSRPGGRRRRLAPRRNGLRPVGATADRAARREGRPRTPYGHRRDRRPPHRPDRPGRPLGRLRTLPARRRAHLRHRQGTTRRGGPLTARPGRRLPRAATSPRNAAPWSAPCTPASCSAWPPPPPWSSASTSRAWTPSSSPAIPAPGRRCGSRPAGPDAPGRAPWPSWWPATTRWTPSSSTTPRRCSSSLWSRPSSTRTTRTSSPPICARRPRSFRSPRPTWSSSGPPCPSCCRSWRPRNCSASGRRAGTGPAVSGPPTSPTSGARAAARSRSSRRAPAGCWAPSTNRPPTPPSTTEPSTSTRAAPIWSGNWIWRTRSPWSSRPTRRTRQPPVTPPPSPSWRPTPRSRGVTGGSVTAPSKSPTRSSPSCVAN